MASQNAAAAPDWTARVRSETEKILHSAQFAHAPFASRFLRYVVDLTLDGHGDEIKEYRIGTDVFDRGQDFDPKIDTIVRVEGSRLRKRLALYYDGEGAADFVQIEIPRGTYQPKFAERVAVAPPEVVPQPEAPFIPTVTAASRTAWSVWRISLLAVMGVAGYFLWTAVPTMDGICRWRTGLPCEKRITVLPFSVIAGDGPTTAMAEGLLHVLTGNLSEVGRFQKSFWTVPAIATPISNAAQARRMLGVNLVVIGTIQKTGEVTTLTLSLVDVSGDTPRQLQARAIHSKMREPVAIHSECLRALTDMLDLELQPPAAAVLAAGASQQPSAQDYYLKGLGYLEKDSASTALSLFANALEVDPKSALAHAGIVSACLRQFVGSRDEGWIQRAEDSMRIALAEGPNLADVRYVSGTLQRMKGEKEAALGEFQHALRLNPRHDRATAGLASLYEAMNMGRQAEETFQKAIQLQPGYYMHHLELGLYYSRRGRYREAETSYLQAAKLAPDSVLALSDLAALYIKTNQLSKATTVLERSVAVKPSASAYNNLGEIYFLQGRYRDMLEPLERAVEAAPSAPGPLFSLATAYRLTGVPAKARAMYEESLAVVRRQLAVTKDSPGLRSLAALNLAYLDRSLEAVKLANEAAQAAPANLTVQLRALLVMERCGQRDRALQIWRRLSSDPASVFQVNSHPDLKSLRADRRYAVAAR